MSPGIELVHKEVGPTSFSLVQGYLQAAQQAAGTSGRRAKRVCHGGTLDPFASGLLLMLLEPATRLFDSLHEIPKIYEATVRWGVETDNGDPLGKPISTGDASGLSVSQLDEVLAGFVGWHEQTPHVTSAKRIGGERAYVRAQRGETVAMPAMRVYLHEASWVDHDLPRQSRLRLSVRGGYYVRALARDLGRAVGCGAHLSQLHRAAIGPWQDPGPGQSMALHGREILPWLPSRTLLDEEVGVLRRGLKIPKLALVAPEWPLPPGFPEPDPLVRGFHQDRFCFVLRPEGGALSPVTEMRGGV